MAHNLEQFDNGQVAFALRGAPAWHGLTNHTFGADDHVTTTEMLDAALLSNWNVRLEDMILPAGYTCDKLPIMVVRDNPVNPEEKNVLATVGDRYKTYQNEQLFSFGDGLLDGGGYWESAGSIKGGRTVFGSLKLGTEITLDGEGINDKTEMYLLVVTSHDGSSAIQVLTTPVRVVCQNTLTAALNGAQRTYKVRHTATAEGRMEEARHALGIANNYASQFALEAQALFATQVSDKTFWDIVKAVHPAPADDASKAGLTKYETKIDLVSDLYFKAKTQDGIRGTAWGVFNALTEYQDYGRGIRGDGQASLISASGFDAGANATKSNLLSVVKSLASV
jgi:phage/plasmid-like protein (TIGR03299 family)